MEDLMLAELRRKPRQAFSYSPNLGESADKSFPARRTSANTMMSIFALAEPRQTPRQVFSCLPNLGESADKSFLARRTSASLLISIFN